MLNLFVEELFSSLSCYSLVIMQEKWCISSKDYHIDTCMTESNRNSHLACYVYATTAFTAPVVLESMHDETHGLTKYLQMTTDVMHISHKLSETSSKAEESESRSVLLQTNSGKCVQQSES
jgi:hypothetical protein